MAFVKGQTLSTQIRLGARLSAAFLTSSILVFATVRAIGSVAVPLHRPPLVQALLLGAFVGALILDLHALYRNSWCPLGVQRQTPKGIQLRLGLRRAALAWGFDAGCVVTTYRVSALAWALILTCLVGIGPWWLGMAYGFGFIVPLWFGWASPYFLPGNESAVKLASMLQWHPGVARAFVIVASGMFLTVLAAGGKLS